MDRDITLKFLAAKREEEQREHNSMHKEVETIKRMIPAALSQTRDVTIKEFADRLKNKFYSYYEGLDENTSKSKYNGETLMYYEVADMIENCIDNTVKEMTEEHNG